jgi:hypothetical protein
MNNNRDNKNQSTEILFIKNLLVCGRNNLNDSNAYGNSNKRDRSNYFAASTSTHKSNKIQ